MLMPSIFGENLFDDFFNDFPFYDYDKEMKNTEKKLYGRKASHVMKTDIRELDDGYEVVVDLPGFTKDEVQATLENGYLTISAEKGLDKDEKEKESYLGERDRLFPWCQNAYRSLLFSRFRYNSSALIMVSSIFCCVVPDGKYFFSRFFGIFHCST